MTDSDERTRVDVTVTGVVQAVGFRPFVYRRANAHDLAGSVRNTGDAGVDITLEGDRSDVEAFLSDLRERPPPLSVVETVTVEERDPTGETGFEIEASTDADGGSGTIPPDTGICDACLSDIRNPDSRYHEYWATSCVDCGPRYTVVESLPYDRPRTTMAAFPLCSDCREEYEEPSDRRYHAQTIACQDCGPELSLLDGDRVELATGNRAIDAACTRLADGDIVAIRGIGGTHLACLATDPGVVERLRERTGRPAKPFAVMAPSIEAVDAFATVDRTERDLLTDVRRPIVALDADRGQSDSKEWLSPVAPGLHTIGVMLPYAGLHHLLFDAIEDPLVMTSGNLPGKPMATTVEAIYDDLADVIDAALVHDREIVTRCDDSVVRVVDDDRRFLRRSRGWVPRPLPRRDSELPVLALGAEFDATVAIARDDEVLPSQHLGDVDDPATEAFLRGTVDHLTDLFGVDPAVVACDLHPDFRTSELAKSYADGRPVRVQHHHAHAAGLLGEHGIDRAVVVAADGTGYGPDGTIWGGEVLDVTRTSFDRVGGLSTFRLPGGEAAIRTPARILASLLEDEQRILDLLADRTSLDSSGARTVLASLDADVNAPQTTSGGRFLDAISALLGVCTRRRYQGEPALRLEAAAAGATPIDIDVPYISRDGQRVVDVGALARRLDELHDDRPTDRVAATAQEALGRGLATVAVEAAEERGVDAVGFTGGIAYNESISRTVRRTVTSSGVWDGSEGTGYVTHERVPPGDAGLSYGQVIVATERTD